MANTTNNETTYRFAPIGSLTGRGGWITTATVGSTIAAWGRANADGSLPRIENQEASDYTVHCGDEALAREAGV